MPAPRWNAPRFLDLLQHLGRLRVISISGPSVFEALCHAGPYEERGGSLNMITEEFHWHLDRKRFRWLQSHDDTHARSKRRVLYFELSEQPELPPFLRIYVYRPAHSEFDPTVEAAFLAAHGELEKGRSLELGESQ